VARFIVQVTLPEVLYFGRRDVTYKTINPLKLVGTSEEMEARLEYEDALLTKRERAANSGDSGSGSSSSKSNAGNILNESCIS